METHGSNRRDFLLSIGGVAGASFLQAQWPEITAAAQHAHQAAKSSQEPSFDILTVAQAKEVEAIAARIIPTDDQPGATEAGVVYFIDIALKTFASDMKRVYDQGIPAVNALTNERFPGVARFSAATHQQQDEILAELAGDKRPALGRFGRNPGASPDFFQTITFHTVFGYLVDPEGGGNRDYVGWKAIGRDPAHSFSPPFGFYDKNYHGWQAAPSETNEK
jgi:gluconate 2-dehydrogenase gamma chain